MLELSETVMTGMAVHFVGNQSREEGVTRSRGLLEPSPELEIALIQYFTRSFQRQEVTYKFGHPTELNLNLAYAFCSAIFEDDAALFDQSVNLTQHLYRQSEHPHIKSGEVYVVRFQDVVLEGELVDAVGIFKSERKDEFLLFGDQPSDLSVVEGISLGKLDKGCMIFNTEKEDGFRVATVDNNSYDTRYWIEQFLGLVPDENETFHTKQVVEMCKEFSASRPEFQEDKTEQLTFLSKSAEYLNENETFALDSFAQAVMPDQKVKEEFLDFGKQFEETRGLELADDFEIAKPAVQQLKKQVKNAIKLDTNIQIKLDFNEAQSASQYLEKGYDDQRHMYYYKVYFNREMGD